MLRFWRKRFTPLPPVPYSGFENEAAIGEIARLARELTLDDMPAEVVHKAKQLLLMGFAWSLLGVRSHEAEAMAGLTTRLSGDGGRCTVFGRTQAAGCATAAFLNAAHAQIYDCNDGHSIRGAWHAGRVLIPAVCAVAEEAGASGKELLEALIFGYEVSHRAHWNESRFHSVAVGAAAAAGRLLKLSGGQWMHAIQLSYQHGPILHPGPGNFNSDANHLCNGVIARQAVEGAFMAGAGMTADTGPGKLMLDADLPDVRQPDSFLIRQVYIKPHIACRYCHNAIDMLVKFRREHPDRIGQIERVEVEVAPARDFIMQYVKPDAPVKTSHFSLPYSAACTLLDGEMDERQSTPQRIAAADLQALQRKVIVKSRPRGPGDPTDAYPAMVRIMFSDGTVHTDTQVRAKGSAANPLSDAEVVELFGRWAGSSLAVERKAQVVEAVNGLEAIADAGELLRLLRVEQARRI